jgi:1-deoxy-D-xylulose-5-phosphate reductoisomerase
LTFEEPDSEKFPCLDLAYKALRIGDTMPAVLNAANEIAVEAFLGDKIRLSDIPNIIETVMSEHETQPAASLETILAADKSARTRAAELFSEKSAFVSLNNIS